MPVSPKPVVLSVPVKARLTAIKQQRTEYTGRQVTYSEVIEGLLERWDATGGLIVQVTESQEAGR